MITRKTLLLSYMVLFCYGLAYNQTKITLQVASPTDDAAETQNAGDKTIAEIQGEGDVSPLENALVSTTGIVTKVFTNSEPYDGAGYNSNINGFFIQDTLEDGNPLTSEGLFIYSPILGISEGDLIKISGKVTEYYGLTEINEVSEVTIIDSGMVIYPKYISLPVASSFEAYEGMLVTFDSLTVTENRNIENYGELRLSGNGPLIQPTQIVDPNDADPDGVTAHGNTNVDAVDAHLDIIYRNNVILDDARTSSYPSPVPYLDANGTIKVGTTLDMLTGVMDYSYGEYRIQPVEAPEFNYSKRETMPGLGNANVKVAAFNVLNYFNGDGQGGGFPTTRGAQSYSGFLKQTKKIVAALIEIDADVVGLMEIENDANNGYSAIEDLVAAINDSLGSDIYDFIPIGIVAPANDEADEIKVALIYKPTKVGRVGGYAILNNDFDPGYHDNYNRPAVAQTFEDINSGQKFTVVVNHLKSKGSDCDELGDLNDSDGQGNCNITRTEAAGTLASWLESDPTNTGVKDYLIIGDLNAYAQEDAIDTLRARGFVNLVEDDYSYIYNGQLGTLDYGMANAGMLEKVTSAKVWHINSPEPDYLSYFGEEEFYKADAYRSSDHDPVIIGLKFIPNLRIRESMLVDVMTDEDIMVLR